MSGKLSDAKFEHVSAAADPAAVTIHADARLESKNR
jgi:hypothetical protein